MRSIDQLLTVMQQLRHPQSGCPWDVQQTFSTIAPFTIEEAYEVADAIERNDMPDLRDELGDLLFQVVFHAQMASEMQAFSFDDVADAITQKMVRRHPHVFNRDTSSIIAAESTVSEPEDVATELTGLLRGDNAAESHAVSADLGQLSDAWEQEKALERAEKHDFQSAMDDVALALPALKRAQKLQKRAATVGFDWLDANPVWGKIDEEIDELKVAVSDHDIASINDELGDVLFAVVNLARHIGVDAESALQQSSKKFEKRFRQVETLAQNTNKQLSGMDESELDTLWE